MLTDGQIKTNIAEEFWWSPIIDSDDINIEVEDKVATLTGNINSWQERVAAIENAFEGGAEMVKDKLVFLY